MTYNDKARGKIYYFALNGQTGKIWGELPVDQEKAGSFIFKYFYPGMCDIAVFRILDRLMR